MQPVNRQLGRKRGSEIRIALDIDFFLLKILILISATRTCNDTFFFSQFFFALLSYCFYINVKRNALAKGGVAYGALSLNVMTYTFISP